MMPVMSEPGQKTMRSAWAIARMHDERQVTTGQWKRRRIGTRGRAADDLPLAAHHAAVGQLGADVGRLVGDREDRVGDAELDAERVDGLGERALHADEGADEEVADADAVEVALAEAVAEEVAEEAVVLGEGGEAVADVADLGDAEDLAELAAVAAVVGDADEGGDVEGISGEAAEDLGLAGSPSDANYSFASHWSKSSRLSRPVLLFGAYNPIDGPSIGKGLGLSSVPVSDVHTPAPAAASDRGSLFERQPAVRPPGRDAGLFIFQRRPARKEEDGRDWGDGI
jgi:hypothetical protein